MRLSLFAAVTAATAETYPSRTITIIVPFPAGGPTDTTAREVANALSQKFKQTVIIENVTGGDTFIATTKPHAPISTSTNSARCPVTSFGTSFGTWRAAREVRVSAPL